MSTDVFTAMLEAAKTPTLTDQKKASLTAAEAKKKLDFDPNWRPVDEVQDIDADTIRVQGEDANRRLSGRGPGYYPDSAETAPTEEQLNDPNYKHRYDANPGVEWNHKKAYGAFHGVNPQDVTREQLYDWGERQKNEAGEFFGDQPREIMDTGDVTHGRKATRMRNAEGEEYGDKMSGYGDNASYYSDYNATQGLVDIGSGKAPGEDIYNRDRSVGEVVKDSAVLAGNTAANIALGAIPEAALTAENLSLMNLFKRALGVGPEKGPVAELDRRLGVTKGIAELKEDIKSEYLSGPEQKQAAKFSEHQQRVTEGSADRIAKWKAEGDSDIKAGAKNIVHSTKEALKYLWENPARIGSAAVESAPYLVGTMAVGRTAMKKMAKNMDDLVAKDPDIPANWRESPELVKKVERKAAAAGIVTAGFMEGQAAGAEMREKIRGLSDEEIQQSPEAQKLIAEGHSVDEAREVMANDAATIASTAMTGVTALTGGASGADALLVKMMGPKLLKEAGVDIAQKGLVRGGTEAAARTIGKTAEAGAKEGTQEYLEGSAEAGVSNLIETFKTKTSDAPLTEGLGYSGAVGAASGIATGGAVGTASQGAREVAKAASPTETAAEPKKKGTVKFRDPKQKAGMQPKLLNALDALGQDITVTSGHRGADHASERGKKKPGRHFEGDAADISTKGMSDEQKKDLVRDLYRNGISRVITYDSHGAIHVDMKKQNGKDWHPMHERTNSKMDSAPQWFKDVSAEIESGKVAQGATPKTAAPEYSKSYKANRKSEAIPSTPRAQRVNSLITSAAQKHNLPPIAEAYMRSMVEIESEWGKNTVGPIINKDIKGATMHTGDRAKGIFQFMRKTAKAMGIDPNDDGQATDATAKMMRKSYDVQRRKAEQRGEKVSEDELWLRAAIAHHSGSHYEKLGENGRKYEKDLREKVNKYLSRGEVAGGAVGTTVRESTPSSVAQAEKQVASSPDIDMAGDKDVFTQFDEAANKYKDINNYTDVEVAQIKQLHDQSIRQALTQYEALSPEVKQSEQGNQLRLQIQQTANRMKEISQVALAKPATAAMQTLRSPDTQALLEGKGTPEQKVEVSETVTAAATALRSGLLGQENLSDIAHEPTRKILEGAKAEYGISEEAARTQDEKLGLAEGNRPGLLGHSNIIKRALAAENPAQARDRLADLQRFENTQVAKRHEWEQALEEGAKYQPKQTGSGPRTVLPPEKIKAQIDQFKTEEGLMTQLKEGHLASLNQLGAAKGKPPVTVADLQKRIETKKRPGYRPGKGQTKPSKQPPKPAQQTSKPAPRKAKAKPAPKPQKAPRKPGIEEAPRRTTAEPVSADKTKAGIDRQIARWRELGNGRLVGQWQEAARVAAKSPEAAKQVQTVIDQVDTVQAYNAKRRVPGDWGQNGVNAPTNWKDIVKQETGVTALTLDEIDIALDNIVSGTKAKPAAKTEPTTPPVTSLSEATVTVDGKQVNAAAELDAINNDQALLDYIRDNLNDCL